VPGAGIRPYYGANINENVTSLQIGIHGIPVNLYNFSLYHDAAHWRYPEQSEEGHQWLIQKIGVK
jgi:hypothetical protein